MVCPRTRSGFPVISAAMRDKVNQRLSLNDICSVGCEGGDFRPELIDLADLRVCLLKHNILLKEPILVNLSNLAPLNFGTWP